VSGEQWQVPITNMRVKPHPAAEADERRHRAELRLREQHPETGAGRSVADTQRRVHELQVHQIELEIQNEELQQARDTVEAALDKYSDLYDFAPVGYLTLDRDGTICEANLTSASLLGIERSRLIRRRFGLFLSPTELPAFNAFLKRVFESQARGFCETTLVRKGKPAMAVRLEAAVAASRGECRAVLTDITERKRAEEDRLILSKLESTGILAGGIAHDFNNLLTVILLNLELAHDLAPSEGELARRLEEAKQAALASRALTQQLITFAQGDTPQRKPTALSGLIQTSVRPALSGSRVRCELSLADELSWVEVDEGQIGQVIRNLVLNAREAMSEGGTITVRAANVRLGRREVASLPPGDYVRLSIADQGCGIPQELLLKIFDPYFSTKQRGDQKGMGLGLTICHAILHKHQGAITVTSRVGTGSTFDLYLPAARKPVAPAPALTSDRLPQPARILVMDDEVGIREIVGITLQQMGHEVESVEDGRRAVEAYCRARDLGRSFDAVLLDLTVRGGMGGVQAVQSLLEIDPAVKAIVMSGYANDPVLLEPERHGFKGALAKPFNVRKLQQILSRVLGPVASYHS
jgi:two-component system, cell cycle sensor histidine kinase and response regulator CckA